VADHPLKPAMDRRLGKPLPYQLANPTQAHPTALASMERPTLLRRGYAVLDQISLAYPPLLGRFLRVTHPSATKSEDFVRLACVKHTASVQSEPGSNSSV
jgi:hypothetical protein